MSGEQDPLGVLREAVKSLEVRGYVEAATPDGFIKLIARANEVRREGYRLSQVIPLKGDQLGAIFVPAPRSGGSLF